MKTVDVKPSTYIDSDKRIIKKVLNVGDHVTISKYKT